MTYTNKDDEDVWFTADLHYNHRNILKWTDRPFETVEEMNEGIITEINSKVKKGDRLYLLGDISFTNVTKTQEFLKRINGRKFLIYGNHDHGILDKSVFDDKKIFEWRGLRKELKLRGRRFVLDHFALETWHKQHNGAIMLHGHSHGSLPDAPDRLRMDVGIDNPEFKVYHIDDIIKIMDAKLVHMEANELNGSPDHH